MRHHRSHAIECLPTDLFHCSIIFNLNPSQFRFPEMRLSNDRSAYMVCTKEFFQKKSFKASSDAITVDIQYPLHGVSRDVQRSSCKSYMCMTSGVGCEWKEVHVDCEERGSGGKRRQKNRVRREVSASVELPGKGCVKYGCVVVSANRVAQ